MAGGTYGAFFEGQASLDFDTDFTVFEMSDLATREELRSVVLSAIMFMTSQAMTRSPRSVRKLLLIDEAWSMLKGGSMGEFVETYARTCRKYGGALATATQSLNDYYKSDGATAALENSDWMLILQQKPETIADFKASSYSREARRAEELANRLESQASFFEGNSAAGSLNLSQAYREWGLVEIERNRDFYGNVRFDDLAFQLSPEGQALQGKFIESYADQLRDGIEDRLVLSAGQPISRPTVAGPESVRGRAQIGGGGPGNVPQVDSGDLHDEVRRAQAAGRQRIRGSRGRLDAATKGAQGASAESADEVKEW